MIWSGVLIFFLLLLIITFKYLEVSSLSMIPLISLFVITTALLILILNILRVKVINKVINKEYIINQKILKLYIYKNKQLENIEEKKGLFYECSQLPDECRKY